MGDAEMNWGMMEGAGVVSKAAREVCRKMGK